MDVFWLEQTLADVPSDDDWLSNSESLRCSSLHAPKRRADWRLGRWTAKNAVATRLDLQRNSEALATVEIRPDASGVPEVFLTDQQIAVCISISHSAGVAACAVLPDGTAVGCDLEVVERREPAFVADYFTSDEQERISRAVQSERDTLITLIWSAKESALKALHTGLRLDTRCVAVKIREDASLTTATWAPLSISSADDQVLKGWWRSLDGLVRTIIAVPASDSPITLAARS